MDLAFGGVQRPYLIKLSQDDLFPNLPTEEEQNAKVHMRREATPMKQAAEWGTRLLPVPEQSFREGKDELP